MSFKPRKHLRGEDVLRTLPPEELEKISALTQEEIRKLLERGAEEARALDRQLRQTFRPPRGWCTNLIY